MASTETALPGGRPGRGDAAGLLLILLCAAVLAPSAWSAALHCDETNVLRHVTRFASGEFGSPGRPGLLWLALTPITLLREPALIALGGRLAGLLAATGTVALVWRLASRPRGEPGEPTDSWSGAVGVLVLLGAMGWHLKCYELRTDSFTTPLTLLFALGLWRDRHRARDLILLGLLVGALGLISQKSIYNVAAVCAGYVAFALASPGPLRPGARLRSLLVIGAVSLGLVAAWYLALTLLSGRGGDFVTSNVKAAIHTGFSDDRSWSNKVKTLRGAVKLGQGLWGLGALGVVLALPLARRRPRMLAMAVAALCMVGTIYVHRGYFLYYVTSFEPLVAVVAALPGGLLLGAAARRVHPALSAALLAALLAGLATAAWPRYSQHRHVTNDRQLRVMREVREAFPEPVPYWDLVGVVPGYEETTFFGTGMVRMQFRRNHGQRAFIERARQRKPRFFLRTYMSRDRFLRPVERRWHWRHFVPYRDNLYLLGARRIARKDVADRDATFECLVPGPYTVWFSGEWKGKASVDGKRVKHGEVIELTEGKHRMSAHPSKGSGQLWLMLGADRVPQDDRSDQHVDWSLYPRASRNKYQNYDRKGRSADLLTQPQDASVTPKDWKARRKRHLRAQQKRDRSLAYPKPPAKPKTARSSRGKKAR